MPFFSPRAVNETQVRNGVAYGWGTDVNRLLGHCLILIGAGAAACAASLAIERRDEGTAVSLARRPSALGVPAADAVPQSREALVRLLERELTRVGCYEGIIGGTWGSEPQAAMRAFLARVNARLPVAQPDEIQLRLLQGERQRVCAGPCRPEPRPGREDAEVCSAGDRPSSERSAESFAPTGAPAAVAELPAAGVASRADQPAAADRTADTETSVGAHRTPLRHPPKANRPPKIVRLLLRNLQRFAQFP